MRTSTLKVSVVDEHIAKIALTQAVEKRASFFEGSFLRKSEHEDNSQNPKGNTPDKIDLRDRGKI